MLLIKNKTEKSVLFFCFFNIFYCRTFEGETVLNYKNRFATIVFFGSAFTIITFHVDIGIQKTFVQFYEQLMGETKPALTELEISYSIGLAVGIIVFFNHL